MRLNDLNTDYHYGMPMRTLRFSLVELLVAISILASLATLLQPALANSLQHTRRIQCSQNMQVLSAATYLYTEDNDSSFPSFIDPLQSFSNVGTSTWQEQLSGYDGRDAFDGRDVGGVEISPFGDRYDSKIYKCPADDRIEDASSSAWQERMYKCSYAINGLYVGSSASRQKGAPGVYFHNMSTKLMSYSRPAEAIIYGEMVTPNNRLFHETSNTVYPSLWWNQPQQVSFHDKEFIRCQYAFMDGSVRWMDFLDTISEAPNPDPSGWGSYTQSMWSGWSDEAL